MWIRTVTTAGIALNSYVVGDSFTNQAIVIDPSRNVLPILEILSQEGLQVRYILETHVHADCISGSLELQSRLKENPSIVCSSMGGEDWIPPYANLQAKNGEIVTAGPMRFEAVHTPGHTPEHLIWILYDLDRSGLIPFAAFTGDLLFVGSVGRPDLLGRESLPKALSALHHSLFSTLSSLPDSLLIYPAHGTGSLCGKRIIETAVTTLGYERKLNPYLQPSNEELWNEQMLDSLPEAPLLFASMKQQNRAMHPLMRELPEPKILPCEELLHLSKEAQCIDTRPFTLFAFGHLPGFISIALRSQFTYWVTQWVDPTHPIYIIATNKEELDQVLEQFALIGIDTVEGCAYLDRAVSESMIGSLVATPCLSPQMVEHLLEQQGDHFCLLDVRFEHEREASQIPGSVSIPLQELAQRFKTLPKGVPITTMCRTGPRAAMAASYLQAMGFGEVSMMLGGIEAWKKAKLPLEGPLGKETPSGVSL